MRVALSRIANGFREGTDGWACPSELLCESGLDAHLASRPGTVEGGATRSRRSPSADVAR